MNLINKLLFSAVALLSLAGCSDDLVNRNGKDDKRDETKIPGVYMGVSFRMPGMGQQTRSYTDGDNTSNSGVEVGTDIENNVNEVIVVLSRNDDYGFIGAATVLRNNIYKHTTGDKNEGAYHAAARFDKTDLDLYYNDPNYKLAGDPNQSNPNVAIFLIVNPTGGLIETLKSAKYGDPWIDATCRVNADGSATEGSIWSSTNGGNFLMTNAAIAIREIPTTMDAWNKYTNESNPFTLSENNTADQIDNSKDANRGPVTVQRAAARFDFRDGSPLGNNTYHVVYISDKDGKDDEANPLIDVQLNKMCLVNMSTEFFYLKRVSDSGLNGSYVNRPEGWALCGAEKPWFTDMNGNLVQNKQGNYVVDCFANVKDGGLKTGFSDYFSYAFFDNDGNLNAGSIDSDSRWAVYQIDEVLQGTQKDNYAGDDKADKKTEYTVWRYVTENTIPGVENQVNGISTGVVFKGKMKANASLDPDALDLTDSGKENMKQLIAAINDSKNEDGLDSWQSPILYSFAGRIYCGWENIRQGAIEASFTIGTDGNPDWNRTNTLYKAVFGDGGAGKFTFNGQEYNDNLEADPLSANSNWIKWSNAGRPSTNPGSSTPENIAIAEAFKKSVTSAKITMYQRSNDDKNGWGYYCYYYYWNRHNDNGRNGIMGPMEFAVVRNNVYKLSVSKISQLGHPRRSDNDPEDPKPDTPDELSNIYITVDTEVLPWVVRINDIEF